MHDLHGQDARATSHDALAPSLPMAARSATGAAGVPSRAIPGRTFPMSALARRSAKELPKIPLRVPADGQNAVAPIFLAGQACADVQTPRHDCRLTAPN
jgi:hypothetical protein